MATTVARRGLHRCTRNAQAVVGMRGGLQFKIVRYKSTKPQEKSFLNLAYSNLRWRIATSLTESLSKEEQKELLDRLNITDATSATIVKEVEEEEEATRKSIAEAVAQARLEEKQKQSAQWEQEKAQLLANAEEATKARVENELAIQKHRFLAFDKWQQDVVQETNNATSTSTETETTTTDHPVLGNAIVDLGYKRVHVASVQVLQSLPVWKKQRTYRHKRAKKMADDKMKTLHLGMQGVISLHEDMKGQLSILDGQHRVGMMAILEEKKKQLAAGNNGDDDFFDFDQILVEVYPEQESQEGYNDNAEESPRAQEIFLEINKAEPVKLVDLPGTVITAKDRKTINEGAKLLEESYPAMFSASQRCRAPHLNIDNLRDALFKSEAVKRHNLNGPKAMLSWMLEHNERLKAEFTEAADAETSSSNKKADSVSKTALEKAIKNDLYLGLDSTWLLA